MSGWQVFVEVAGRPPFEVRPGESIVGRSRLAQIHIPESTVSRQHARLLASPLGEVTVEDLGSSNGTYVNNEKVEGRRQLADGDRIHVGDAELRVRIVAPVAPSEATVRMSLPPMGGPPPAQPLPPAPAPAPLPPPPASSPYSPPPAVTPPPYAPAPLAPPRPVDPPLFAEPPRPPASPPPVPVAAPRPSPPPAPPRAAPRRGPELPSVTAIDRLPIPEATPEVIRASKLARATPAGFGVRFAAALIDAALVTFLAIPLWIVASFAVRQSPIVATFAVPAVFALLSLVYPIVFWATKGATPGKIFLRLRIIGPRPGPEDGLGWRTAIVRFVGYLVSAAFLGSGFLVILFTSQKQGLHDLIAGTRVVRLR
jgi:uncharacterized RDD family membrane protein YckC